MSADEGCVEGKQPEGVPPERAVFIHGGPTQVGDHNVQNVNVTPTFLPASAYRPVTEVLPPVAGLVSVPHRTLAFVGRRAELARIGEALGGEGRAVVHAVHGLGGIGKSALAAQWASVHAAEHSVTWWIAADSPASIEEGLAKLGVFLQPELNGARLDFQAERAVQWLASHTGWLLVLDNVTHPADIAPLLSWDLSGRVLVTSRLATGWDPFASTVLSIDVLTDPDALELLAGFSGDVALDGGSDLCAELGNLPLAIEQAGAFIGHNGMSPREYLQLLCGSPALMYGAAVGGSNPDRTIARIWRVSLDKIADTPLAGQLLRILGWYADEEFPRGLLLGLPDPARVQEALSRLTDYHLITLSEDRTGVTVHRLLRAFARTPDPADPHRQPEDIRRDRAVATRILAGVWPSGADDPANWPVCRTLTPHIAALAQHSDPAADTTDTVYLFSQAGTFLTGQGMPAQAVSLHLRAHQTATRALGADDPASLHVLGLAGRHCPPGRRRPRPGDTHDRGSPGKHAPGPGPGPSLHADRA